VSLNTEPATAQEPTPRAAVIGVGNVLLRDEGVGVHVVRALQEVPPADASELTIIDGGTCPETFYLLPPGVDKLIIVDAVRGGCEPGTIYRFTPQDIVFGSGPMTSLHQLGLAEGLRMLEHTELTLREIVILGVEPKEIGWGLTLSQELQKQVPRILDLVKEEIGQSAASPS
jgi:hydrogenase maturation protease